VVSILSINLESVIIATLSKNWSNPVRTGIVNWPEKQKGLIGMTHQPFIEGSLLLSFTFSSTFHQVPHAILTSDWILKGK